MGVWKELGIEPTLDARAVRRAYAIKLKSIDQATELERFERLRAAYGWALAWIADQASSAAPAEPAPAPIVDSPALERSRDFSVPPPPPGTKAVASDIEAAYARLLAEAGERTVEQLTDRLRGLLDSLLNLEAREELELLVLNDVLAPRPFRERLLSAAAQAFRWDESLHHLADRSLEAAREMHAWLAERVLLRSVPPPDGQSVETILASARDCFQMRNRKVAAAEERQIAQTIRDMRYSFPTVLRYPLDDEIVDYWLYRPDLSSAVLRGPGRTVRA